MHVTNTQAVTILEPNFTIPVLLWKIQAGFPSPAEDYAAGTINLNTHLIHHPEATFVLRVSGHSMQGAGIFDGDEILVDRALTPSDGRIVVACVNGEMTVKRLRLPPGQPPLLVPENPEFPTISFQEGEECQIWGVVTRVLHRV
ncbi:translesion error-prone DNA polymerase V autoproteolytic subunit [Acidithiobacillus ferridurans]|uniref:LexA family protein n=1 Tax=Acidithiobacillus ferridurans TaxID=1232575 RepID=UPI001C07B31A|nr:translesion error-prone DNA polymerase V autoproteolytic subunit [Acidithiobacillus ferridurans]MBU2805644.1 translesion error-prone DNA polymerase V autoproteolytic subunit [Acidithiobacillus ferridurans]